MTGQSATPPGRPLTTCANCAAKSSPVKPGQIRRHQIPPQADRSISALLVLRDQVTDPLLVGIGFRRRDRIPAT
jgi:hypothetical protein